MIDFFSSNLKGKTFIFRLDPRIKFISLLIVFISLLLLKHIEYYLIWLIITFITIFSNKIHLKFILKPFRFFIFLFIMTIIFHSLLTPGRVILHYYKIFVTIEGIQKGLFFSLRLFLIIIFSYIFSLTTNPMDLTDGLSRLFSPLRRLRFPVDDLFIIIHIAIRFIPTLLEQSTRILMAQRARGLNFNVNIIKRIKHISSVILPIIILSIRRANELALALEARWYHPGKKRTSFIAMRLKRIDFAIIAILLIFTGGIHLCETLRY
ncbi:energy-coupling factor transporter transmembrane protein EcfT [candidate division WOR-3 bacterium]|nr:energy-coupling factor transporter transmembrane protein EcfT [candidate division WOR-3 bacterium]MCK4575982.1 energy-coupling factor transporter transmembrane protein EcfT [candidate division WOR-3 bacterium]